MIMQKLTTLVRGSARESADKIIDVNAIRIFEQEICDCESGVRKAKATLTLIVAERISIQRRLDQTQAALTKYESQAVEAMNQSLDSVAEQFAQRILGLEDEYTALHKNLQQMNNQERALSEHIQSTVNNVQRYRRELAMAKATEHSQKLSCSLHSTQSNIDTSGCHLEESLQRIKRHQQQFSDQSKAAECVDELLQDSLDKTLKDKGIGQVDKAAAVLDRIKKKAESHA